MSQPCGCCKPASESTPEEIFNRPALSAIAYRVGTYATFRQAMLTAISQTDLGESGKSFRPLSGWSTRRDDDYGITLLDMWAYLADILTFYQERIANEAYLRTALQRDSIIRLADLIGYQLAPGMAAKTYLAYTLEKNTELEIPERLRAQSVPAAGETAQKFETVESLDAQSLFNSFRVYPEPRTCSPLAAGGTSATVTSDISAIKKGNLIVIYTPVSGATSVRRTGAGLIYGIKAAGVLNKKVVFGSAGIPMVTLLAAGNESEEADPVDWEAARKLLHIEEKEITSNEKTDWRQVLGWKPEIRADFGSTAVVRRWKRKFRLLGHNAPSHYFSIGVDSNSNVQWSQKTCSPYLDKDDTLQLDAAYDNLKENTEILLVAVLEGGGAVAEEFTVSAVENTNAAFPASSDAAPALQAAVTQLVLDADFPDGVDVRSAVVYELEGDALELWDKEYPAEIQGNAVYVPLCELTDSKGVAYTAAEAVQLLESGRRIILEDGLVTPQATTVDSVLVDDDHLKITLEDSLSSALQADASTARANVLLSTHGETVSKEILGDGDASQGFQSFELKKTPLTYVPDAGAENGAASTLEMRVENVLWKEVAHFYGQSGQARVYTIRIDDEKTATVRFGDGRTGARLPSGKKNLIATYRQGIGEDGNVGAGKLTVALDKPVGLKSVTNPIAAEGGSDPESLSQARTNAPATVRTLGRIVSLSDFEDAARSYAGIAKAKADWQWDGMEQAVLLTVAGDDGAAIEAGGTTHSDLVADLDSRRDPHRKLTVTSYVSVPVKITAAIRVASDLDEETVQAAALGALEEYLAFDNLDLGQSIHLSDVMRVLQSVEGVEAVDVDALQYKDTSDRTSHGAAAQAVLAHLPIFPTELATVSDPETDLAVNIGMSQS
jgi:hypothetical protein